MHQHAVLFGQIAGIIGALSFIPYIRSIVRGETKPNRASWTIWTCVSIIVLASYHSSGASSTVWLFVVYAIFPIIILLLSLKHGVGGFSALDAICLAGAFAGLILWKITDSPETALYINIVVDMFGFVPTFKKAYLHPETENSFAWGLGAFATLINVFAITSWHPQIALLPVYNCLANVAVFLTLSRRHSLR